MEKNVEVTPTEVMAYQYGQKRGFIAGVIFCIAAKYLYDRRSSLVAQETLDDIRTRN